MSSVHAVTDTRSSAVELADQATPSALDVPVVGSNAGLPAVMACATTVSRLRSGSTSGVAALEKGAASVNKVGGLNAVPREARTRIDSIGRYSRPSCQVPSVPKSL